MTLSPLDFVDRVAARGNNQGGPAQAKRLLVDAFGVAEGFAVYREKMTHLPDQGEIRLAPLASLRQVAQQGPGAFHQIAATQTYDIPAPVVVGGGDYPGFARQSRTMFVACLIDARVRARSNVIEVGDWVLLDRDADELALFDDQLDFDASLFKVVDNSAAWVIGPKSDSPTAEIEEAFSLLGIRPQIFGHWLTEYLPKYVAASASGALPPVPILVEEGMPASHYEALQLMLAPPVEIIRLPPFATARVRRLWCAPAPALFPWWEIRNERFNPEYCAVPPAWYAKIFREMRRRGNRTAATSVRHGPRVFLGRKPGMGHALVNHAAIEAAARERDFEIIYAEDLPFAEQMTLAQHADFVLGPMGSATLLAWFGKPPTKVCVFVCAEAVMDYRCERAVADALGMEYTIFPGPTVRANPEDPTRSDFEIDEAAFRRFLDDWLA